MFDLSKILTNRTGSRFICSCEFDNEYDAKYYASSFLMSVREKFFAADLYNKGRTLYIDTPNKDATVGLADALNRAIFNKEQPHEDSTNSINISSNILKQLTNYCRTHNKSMSKCIESAIIQWLNANDVDTQN